MIWIRHLILCMVLLFSVQHIWALPNEIDEFKLIKQQLKEKKRIDLDNFSIHETKKIKRSWLLALICWKKREELVSIPRPVELKDIIPAINKGISHGLIDGMIDGAKIAVHNILIYGFDDCSENITLHIKPHIENFLVEFLVFTSSCVIPGYVLPTKLNSIYNAFCLPQTMSSIVDFYQNFQSLKNNKVGYVSNKVENTIVPSLEKNTNFLLFKKILEGKDSDDDKQKREAIAYVLSNMVGRAHLASISFIDEFLKKVQEKKPKVKANPERIIPKNSFQAAYEWCLGCLEWPFRFAVNSLFRRPIIETAKTITETTKKAAYLFIYEEIDPMLNEQATKLKQEIKKFIKDSAVAYRNYEAFSGVETHYYEAHKGGSKDFLVEALKPLANIYKIDPVKFVSEEYRPLYSLNKNEKVIYYTVSQTGKALKNVYEFVTPQEEIIEIKIENKSNKINKKDQ